MKYHRSLTRTLAIVVLMLSINAPVKAQTTENVILITLDGLRWQELFAGADKALLYNPEFTEDAEHLKSKFWHEDPGTRRQMLMPFLWSTIAGEGQVYGNRWLGNKVDCTNTLWFSYPGYNEILTGLADDQRIQSNDKVNNPNVTVLEALNKTEGYQDKVYAFGSWDVFPFIINEERSGVPVNAGFEDCHYNQTDRESFLNQLQREIRSPWGTVRLDVFTHHFALETLKKHHPRVLYIAYGETDDYAHDGRYDDYLKSAHQTDQYIRNLWEFVNTDEQYRNKTTFIITTDHGRGENPPETWTGHGSSIAGASQIWIAVLGPDTPSLGEVTTETQLYQNQIASTLAAFLGIAYENQDTGSVIAGAMK